MSLSQAKFNMINQQIKVCNVTDQTLLSLLNKVDRDMFSLQGKRYLSFYDLESPLPGGQTTLTPRVESLMLQNLNLDKKNKVLEIGTGSGYITAILANMADYVYSVECNKVNKEFAVNNLIKCGISNAHVTLSDGILGLPERAPFDRIFVGGALLNIPDDLKLQLKVGGKLVGIVGKKPILSVVVIEHITKNKFITKKIFETDSEYLIGSKTKEFIF